MQFGINANSIGSALQSLSASSTLQKACVHWCQTVTISLRVTHWGLGLASLIDLVIFTETALQRIVFWYEVIEHKLTGFPRAGGSESYGADPAMDQNPPATTEDYYVLKTLILRKAMAQLVGAKHFHGGGGLAPLLSEANTKTKTLHT